MAAERSAARRRRRAARGHPHDRPRRRRLLLRQRAPGASGPARSRCGIARALVTNGEWLEFMADGGYSTPTLWLSDGWADVAAQGWNAPGYWQQGRRRLVLDDTRRPASGRSGTAGLPRQLLRSRRVRALGRQASAERSASGKSRRKSRRARRRLRHGVAMDAQRLFALSRLSWPKPGALGEYNGKFMVNQMVLRGSSLATPAGHSRASVSQFLLSAGALAVFRPAARGIRTLSLA